MAEDTTMKNNELKLDQEQFTWKKPMELFQEENTVKICAPMVRYSKLGFRNLVREYGCDIAFTPMIVADSFIRSEKARANEFTTNEMDRPLIVQFAARNAEQLANVAELVSPYSDGVDLNCGCPQRWAMSEGYGCHLLENPEIVQDMVNQTRNRIANPDFTISIKIRVQEDLKNTIELCRRAEAMGLSFVTIHGRTQRQRNEPVNLDAIRIVSEALHIPVIGNGDIKVFSDIQNVVKETGVKGVMVARGLLRNPALFSGVDCTPVDCIVKWCNLSISLGTSFTNLHHHLIYMCENILCKPERRIFNSLQSTSAILAFIQNYLGIPL